MAVRGEGADKEFLMVRHAERGWELPGGKVEPGEGPVHCALREFREETGHLLGHPHYVMKLRKPNGICHVFTGTLGSRAAPRESEQDEPPRKPREAVQEAQWFTRLPRDLGLAFPDDPYEEIGAKLGLRFG